MASKVIVSYLGVSTSAQARASHVCGLATVGIPVDSATTTAQLYHLLPLAAWSLPFADAPDSEQIDWAAQHELEKYDGLDGAFMLSLPSPSEWMALEPSNRPYAWFVLMWQAATQPVERPRVPLGADAPRDAARQLILA